MKKLIFYIFLFCAPTLFAQNREWHVKPLGGGGSTPANGGNGSAANPWDLQSALNNPGSVIHGGDIIWLHVGSEGHQNYVGRFTCALLGDAINYITISSYPGEWAILDGNESGAATFTDPPPRVCPQNSQLPPDPNPDPMENLYANTPDDLSTYSDDDEINIDPVLSVTGGYLLFKNFQVCFTGSYNRTLYDSNPTAFHKVAGINHSPITPAQKSRFVNLVIKNVPGPGFGSWKSAADSEIYGCLIYNNGYIWFNSNFADGPQVLGKGPGIYTQNNAADTTPPRLIKNNIVHNNYDSGVLVWSATTTPISNYVRNYELCDNVLFNNGNPGRKHPADSITTGLDSKPNMVIATDSGNGFNHPTKIDVYRNFFYLNKLDYISGIRLSNSNQVNIYNNMFVAGTKGCSFTRNNQWLTFTDNIYWGKYLQVGATTGINPDGSYISDHWNLNNNKYYIWDYKAKNETFHIPNPSFVPPTASSINPAELRVPLADFKLRYPTAETGANGSFRLLYTNGTHYLHFNGETTGAYYFPSKIKIVQNTENRNLFYVTLFDTNAGISPSMAVNFTSFNIPNGTAYVIKDVQNYANSNILGTCALNSAGNNIISFPMNLPDTEKPNGYYEDITCVGQGSHTSQFKRHPDFSSFTIEFKRCAGVNYEETVSNVTTTTTSNISAKGHVYLGTNYVTNNGSNVIVKAGKSIQVSGTDFFQPGSNVLLKIEDPCPDLAYVGDINSKMSNTATTDIKAVKEVITADNLVIYPNPNSGIFKVESAKGLKIQQVIASDINAARVVFDQKYSNETSVDVDISSQPSGIYVIDVFFEDGTKETQKIIKK